MVTKKYVVSAPVNMVPAIGKLPGVSVKPANAPCIRSGCTCYNVVA